MHLPRPCRKCRIGSAWCWLWALVTASTAPLTAAAEDLQTGAFQISRSPAQLLGTNAARVAPVLDVDQAITWEVFVPVDYDAESPPGLLLWVSPTPSGKRPRNIAPALEDHDLIWISANDAGNRVVLPPRLLKSVLALNAIQEQYRLDEDRIYVAGFSGGGKVASIIASDHATTFDGGIFICGVESWHLDDTSRIPAMQSNRYVFLTGQYDQALLPTRRSYSDYKRAGIPQVHLTVVRGMAHEIPPRLDISQAIGFLDGTEADR